MPKTYEPIATVTASAISTFLIMSSIPATYTDLILVGRYLKSASASARMTINSDTTTLYSQTTLYGNGTSALSNRETGVGYFFLMDFLSSSTTTAPNMSICNLMNYANTTTFKTFLERSGAAGQGAVASVGLWRNTAAINRIDISTSTGTFDAGTTFTLYGIKAA